MNKNFKTRQLFLFIPAIFIYLAFLLEKFSFTGEILLSVLPTLIALTITIWFIIIIAGIIKKTYDLKAGGIILGILLLSITPLIVFVLQFYIVPPNMNIRTDNLNNQIKIMSFNTYFENTNMQPLLEAINNNDPDVIELYELTTFQFDLLNPILQDKYPYYIAPTASMNGAFSKYIFENKSFKNYTEDIGYIHIYLTKNNVTYSIYGIHPPAMLGDTYTKLRYQNIDDIIHDVANDTTPNVIIAGDYNMTPWVSGYKYMMSNLPTGYYNVAQGRGIYNTWSPSYNFNFPISAIDHIVLSPSLSVIDFQNIWINGSDHHALIITTSN